MFPNRVTPDELARLGAYLAGFAKLHTATMSRAGPSDATRRGWRGWVISSKMSAFTPIGHNQASSPTRSVWGSITIA